VYGVVKQHQGWIEVESRVGCGTTFRVYFPRHCETGTNAESRSNEPSIRGGSETILVVEDEHNLRELVCAILESYGYKVLQAASGPKAVEVWSKEHSEVDLLLTDLVMPDRMNGRELAERLWQDEPKLPVVFTSGYSADVVGKDFVLRHGLNYLQKPYHPQKLAVTIRDVLDKLPTAN
jgi:CheY-like chemotaxis protein